MFKKGFIPFFIILLILLALVGGYIIYKHPWGPISNGPLPAVSVPPLTSSNPTVTPKDQSKILSANKSCSKDGDCTMFVCSGCFNKDWAKTATPDNACRQYEGYTCKCVNNLCKEIK